jgi:hypothetical protein
MSSQMVRWGSLAGSAAAVVFLVAAIVNLISPYQRGVFDSFSDYLYQLLVTVAFALITLAIAGLHALQSGSYGRWGTAGASMSFVGYTIIVVVAAATLLAGAAVLLSVRLVGAAAILLGSIVLGIMTIRARVLPWWCGVLIIVGLPLGDVSNALIRGRGDRVRHRVGAGGLGAVVAKWHARGASLTSELNFVEYFNALR